MKKTIAEMEQSAVQTDAEKALTSVFDEDSFTELGRYVGANGEKCSIVSGYGTVNCATIYGFAQDISVKSGAMDMAAANKIKKVYDLALKNGAPVVAIYNSNGADMTTGIAAMECYGEVAKVSAALSGAVPQIAIVDGVCAGTAAMLACMADFVIMTEKSELFMTAPFTADDATEVSGTAKAAAKSGVATIVAKDTEEAVAIAKKLISILPCNNLSLGGNDYYLENEDEVTDNLKSMELISAVADKDIVIELYSEFGSAATTALASVAWRTVGFVSTDKAEYLTKDDCAKIARFVTLCDAFSIPVITFVDTKGFEKSCAAELGSAIRDSAKLTQAYASSTTPKISVIKGHAFGSAYVALASTAAGIDFSFAWENAVISPACPKAMAVFLADDNITPESYRDNEASAFTAAAMGSVDRVIAVADTKSAVKSALDAISEKRVLTPAKKHVNFVF